MTDSQKLDLLIDKFSLLNEDVSSMKDDLSSVKQEMRKEFSAIRQEMNNEFSAVRQDITSIKLTMENEIRNHISIIAEGHLDLTRKLDDSLKVKNERETLLIRVGILESEVRQLKDNMSNIA